MRIKNSQRNPESVEPRLVQSWELYNGCMRLYICGPGMQAWFPVTAASSSSTIHGTAHERNIARKALLQLARRFHNTTEATPSCIRETLEKCGWTPDEFTAYPTDHDSRGDDTAAD
jgi:hypothetical protein